MKYNFDEIVNREATGSKKWDMPDEKDMENVLPMWVADMDFKSPQEVIDAFIERANHGVFGYTWREDSFYDAIINWCKRRYDWDVKKEWILFTPGVVMGLNIGVMKLTEPGDKVMIQTPVYPPFKGVIVNKEREAMEIGLINDGTKYVMDFDNIENSIDEKTKLFMLCSPHNPVGRVWTEEELIKLGNICLERNIPIISDEIHADFIFKNHKHHVLASLSKEFEQNTITLLAPSKTFNIAGLGTSVAIIPNEEIRQKYQDAIDYMSIWSSNIFGIVGLTEAYNHGEEWLDQLLVYLEDNTDYAIDYINKNISDVKVNKPDGTYLLWLDFNDIDKTADEIKDALVNVGKINLNDGRPYGKEGEKFFRLNIGCPRATLEDGLRRIELAVNSLK